MRPGRGKEDEGNRQKGEEVQDGGEEEGGIGRGRKSRRVRWRGGQKRSRDKAAH